MYLSSLNGVLFLSRQFIFTTDGAIGLCFEHSALEGIAIVQMMDRLFKKLENDTSEIIAPVETDKACVPRRLAWNLSDKTRATINVAIEDMDKYAKLRN
jgi:choline O-acetyltransferase